MDLGSNRNWPMFFRYSGLSLLFGFCLYALHAGILVLVIVFCFREGFSVKCVGMF